MINSIQHFFWLAQQTLGGCLYFWQLGLILLLSSILALIFNKQFKSKLINKKIFLVLTSFIFTLLILLVGTVFQKDNSLLNVSANIAEIVLMSIAAVQIIYSLYLIWLLKGFMLFTLLFSLLIIYISLWACFVASMSVSGDWL